MSKDWEVKSLGSLCEVITKGTTPTSIGHKFVDDGVNFLKVESITLNGSFLENKFAYITKDCNNALKRSQLEEGDILFSIAGALGRTAIVTNEILPANTNQALSIIRLKENENILKSYIFLALNSGFALEQIEKYKGGVAQQNLSLTQMKSFQIPLPKIEQQKQIVAILDKAFEAIDKAKENLEKNIQNTKELFQSRLNEIFSQKGEGWEESTILEVCNNIFAGGDKPEENFSKEKTDKFTIPIFANAVKDKGLYGYTNKARVNESAITISARGSGTGHTEIRMESFFPIVRLIVLVPNTEKMSLIFLKYIIDNLDILRSGSAIPQLTVPMIKEYKVDYPSLKKQNEIIDELDSLKQQTKQLETHYQQKLQNLEELKKSILQKAFSGELI
ncbi:restriction endonuclease subunit S [Malaciobacter marinus]|uniref:restriction endonuclease subunit S n=1 Tax=Malaciobacter marinus TaxID=505249 RepID=UPI003AFFD9B5